MIHPPNFQRETRNAVIDSLKGNLQLGELTISYSFLVENRAAMHFCNRNAFNDGTLLLITETGMRRAGLFALVLLGSCTTYAHRGIRPLRPLELATAPYQETATTALTGSLMYEGGCLLFRDELSTARLLPVWPTGSVFNGTSVIFHQPGKADQPVLIGQEFVMEGRPLIWPALSTSVYSPFQHQCAAQPFLVARVRPAD
jgi:hypothetical protein